MRKVTIYLVLGGALLGGALYLKANTHLANCKAAPEGRVCSVVWGAK
jgi:hypothetical protein